MQDTAVALADPRGIHVGEELCRLMRQRSEKVDAIVDFLDRRVKAEPSAA
jgi:hypothetical protein